MNCPTCEKLLETERGMRQHHTKVHGEPLPNRTCKGCDVDFYDPKARRHYCEGCNPNAGKHNGNWKDAREIENCSLCGNEFSYYPSDKPGIYCSDCVDRGENLDELGIDRYERRTVECEQCGESVALLPSRLDRDRGRFCSPECLYEWMARNMTGADHPAWKDGETEYRAPWQRTRREALDRDNHTCQICGTHGSELDTEPHVHHIEPVRSFDDSADAHTLSNLVTLCPTCHPRVEHDAVSLPDGPWRRE